MRSLLLAGAAVTTLAFVNSAVADPPNSTLSAGSAYKIEGGVVLVLKDAQMNEITAGAHIRTMLGRLGQTILMSDPQFDPLGAAGSTSHGPEPGAELNVINGLFSPG